MQTVRTAMGTGASISLMMRGASYNISRGPIGDGGARAEVARQGAYFAYRNAGKGRMLMSSVYHTEDRVPSDGSSSFTDFANFIGTVAAYGGILAGVEQYGAIRPDGSWIGSNGKLYGANFHGNQWISKAKALAIADAAIKIGRGWFALELVVNGTMLAIAALDGDIAGMAAPSANIAVGYIGTFGGPGGFIFAAGYFVFTSTAGLERTSRFATDVACSVTGNC